jgi:hypothetical protein
MIASMKTIAFCVLFLCVCLSVIADDSHSDIPATPALLLKKLKTSGPQYTIGQQVDYVKETDLPLLISLLDSTEPCAFVDMPISSIAFPTKSTVGHEAAYLIEGFWKRYYPTQLTSRQFTPDIKNIKDWYSSWSLLKNPRAEALQRSPGTNSVMNAKSFQDWMKTSKTDQKIKRHSCY